MRYIAMIGALLPVAAGAEDLAPLALNSMDRAPPQMAGARVVDQKGAPVGTVQKIETDASGKPLGLDVAVPGKGSLAVAAADASYDLTGNLVIAQLKAPVRAANAAHK